MRYLLEAFLVGIYSVIIYFLVSFFISSFTLSLLIVGFLKHYLGYYIGIHTLYCKYGEKCMQIHNNNTNYISNNNYIRYFSFMELLFYLILGYIISIFFFWINNPIIKNIIIFFFIGFTIHILSEKYFIHNIFCSVNCNKI